MKPNLTLMNLHEQLQANRAEINALIRKENAILDQTVNQFSQQTFNLRN